MFPSFIRTLEGAIFEIPLRAPIYHELARVQQFNETTERMRTVLKAAYPELAGFVTTVTERVPSTEDASRNCRALARNGKCAGRKRGKLCLSGLCAFLRRFR